MNERHETLLARATRTFSDRRVDDAVARVRAIVFGVGGDPVAASLNRPSGNITGVFFLTQELEAPISSF